MSRRTDTPLTRLGRASGGAGAFLTPAQIQAGERLGRDFERAALQPRVTMRLDAMPGGWQDRGGAQDAGDMAMDARRRVHAALDAVGSELAGPLVDLCCLELGLESVERNHGWPARSAKFLLRVALAALARHYGYDERAEGRDRAGAMRGWMGPDARPSIRPVPPPDGHRP